MSRIEKGRRGEEVAVKLLRSIGYTVLETNFRTKHGEVDIIALDGETIVFVEVKTRTSEKYGTGAEAVDERKQRHIINVSHDYMAQKGLDEPYIRFDVIIVMMDDAGSSAEHYKDAFGDLD